ncbi:MAG TPA: HAD-IIA family hydrolase [Trueperaceae bacterium]|nr:HAD-IIA family hydrolase [Trueperaceae bacterium]
MLADALAFDLDGTVYLEDRPLPGARELMGSLRAARVPYVFATNNSSLPAERYVERLRGMGIEADPSHVLTSTHAAAHRLRQAGFSRAYVLATDEVKEELGVADIAHDAVDPQAVLLTFDTSLDYDKVRTVSDLVRSGLPYFATHPDLVCPTPNGPVPDCGAFIALFAAATGREPEILGKPSGFMATAIRARLGLEAERAGAPAPVRIAFVGDRLYTDVRMANEHGFTAVLTLTGETTHGNHGSSYTPDLVVRDLYELAEHLGLAKVEERSA